MTDLPDRSAAEVFEDHLRLAREGDFEGDLARNVSEDIVAVTPRGVVRGPGRGGGCGGQGGVRELARQLMDEIPNGEWQYGAQLVEGRIAFLEWTVETGPFRV